MSTAKAILTSFTSAIAIACNFTCNVKLTDLSIKKALASITATSKKICICQENGNTALIIVTTKTGRLLLEKHGQNWQKSKILPIKHSTHTIKITKSFYHDGLKAGFNQTLLTQVEKMLRDRVRFDKDLHQGDKISFLVEHKSTEDVVVMASISQKSGKITAMRFFNHGKLGFYDKNGHELVDSFDRAPIKYTKISSHFKNKRHHPILGYVRPHKGVDLVAASGTPIKATSAGEVVSLGALRGYGRTIIIKHKGNIQTLYAHLHGYAKGLKSGDHVHRKQLIGYVGMTGLATAPHCHYEFRINNVPHDPMKVKLSSGEILSGQRLQRFHKKWAARYKLLKQC